ncbi:unnamed protein product [Cylindrotheca closterium]|uniref:Uncharacterized protein n=1 Tax=Cylindrotheca closterium TaxID=2856 RepID=A0AAD2G207_9STRA|nr:unnamed protein product [Cylindrotheca closterium]
MEPGLKTIGVYAFCECFSLSRVSIPPTVVSIGGNAFESCRSIHDVVFVVGSLRSIGELAFAYSSRIQSVWIPPSVRYVGDEAFYDNEWLISVEIPRDSRTTFGWNVFSRSCQLANIALPPSTTQDELLDQCTVLNDAYGSANVMQGIKSRFRGYPVHEACYYAASVESDEMLVRALLIQDENNTYLENLIDPLGMTPFHVLMSTSKKRPDLLKLLLDYYPSNVLGLTCPSDDTALYYLTQNWTTDASIMLRMALQKWMVQDMASWGLPQWRSNMHELVESVFNVPRKMELHAALFGTLSKACDQMECYELMETTSLLELWLWKMKMQSTRNGVKRMAVDRASSRARCGATFIIPTVVDHLLGPDQH